MPFMSLRDGAGKSYYISAFYKFVVSFSLEIMFEVSGYMAAAAVPS